MITKTILITLLVVLAASYTEEDNVLVLTDDDFPGVTKEFSHILIEFYAPWCGHCKKLEPVYKQVATALKEKGSVIKLAKCDATQNKKAPEQFGVRGYPTLFFFYNGQKVDYNGPRSKQGMLGWLEKKTRDPVSQIDADKYASLSQQSGVSIVYHGDYTACGCKDSLTKLAISDDYNTFYWGTGLGRDEGTVEIIRSFGQPVTTTEVDGLQNWIAKHQRPPVVPFDERTIGELFGSGKRGVVLFNGQQSSDLLNVFTEAAKQYDGQSLIFTEVDAKNQHLDNFANYIKLDRKTYPIVVIQSKAQSKYVFKSQATKQNILSFLGDLESHKVGLTDEVRAGKSADSDDDTDQEGGSDGEEQAEQL